MTAKTTKTTKPTKPAKTAKSNPTTADIFVISYDQTSGITDEDKTAAEAILGKVVWFKTRAGSRPPQVCHYQKETW